MGSRGRRAGRCGASGVLEMTECPWYIRPDRLCNIAVEHGKEEGKKVATDLVLKGALFALLIWMVLE